jgi:hypothetical protein
MIGKELAPHPIPQRSLPSAGLRRPSSWGRKELSRVEQFERIRRDHREEGVSIRELGAPLGSAVHEPTHDPAPPRTAIDPL